MPFISTLDQHPSLLFSKMTKSELIKHITELQEEKAELQQKVERLRKDLQTLSTANEYSRAETYALKKTNDALATAISLLRDVIR